MLKNLDNNNDIEAGHMHSGRAFREVPLVNLFKNTYEDKGFYSGEEADLMDKEHSEPTRAEEGKAEEPHWDGTKTSGTTQTTEVSTINPPFVSAALGNQNSQSHQSPHSTITSSSTFTQTENLGNLGRSMADEMRLPTFIGDGSEDPNQHWFLCEVVWSIKNVTDEAVKQAYFSTTLRDRMLK